MTEPSRIAHLEQTIHTLENRVLKLESKPPPRRKPALIAAFTLIGLIGLATAARAADALQWTVFESGKPARASEVNGNFALLRGWLEGKLGPAQDPNVTLAGTLAFPDASDVGASIAIGAYEGVSMSIDSDDIAVSDQGAPGRLSLQANGGSVAIGSAGGRSDLDVHGALSVGEALVFPESGVAVRGKAPWPAAPTLSFTCRAIESARSGAGDDAPASASCGVNEMLTGCTCYSPWDSCDGARATAVRTCTAYNRNGGAGVFANGICCTATLL